MIPHIFQIGSYTGTLVPLQKKWYKALQAYQLLCVVWTSRVSVARGPRTIFSVSNVRKLGKVSRSQFTTGTTGWLRQFTEQPFLKLWILHCVAISAMIVKKTSHFRQVIVHYTHICNYWLTTVIGRKTLNDSACIKACRRGAFKSLWLTWARRLLQGVRSKTVNGVYVHQILRSISQQLSRMGPFLWWWFSMDGWRCWAIRLVWRKICRHVRKTRLSAQERV